MSENLKGIVERAIRSGYQLSSDGFEYLRTLEDEDADKLVRSAILRANSSPEEHYVLDRNFLQSILDEMRETPAARRTLKGRTRRPPLASEYDAQLEVLDEGPGEPAC
ncbi:MAG: hypothetical protein ACE5Z5_14160, partial [Candidatus Bathyarchaeia archaeon]